ncbi:MAG: hypothetical protein U0414_22090 [Polyangiaceae bacterium]
MNSARALHLFLPSLLPLFAVACGSIVETPPAHQQTMSPLGEACGFDAQCASARCSADPDQGQCGTCVTLVALGEACDGQDLACARSASCVSSVCKTNKKDVGDACAVGPKGTDFGDCDDELYCAPDDGSFTNGHCRPHLALGEACVFSWTCAAGTTCDGTTGKCEIPDPSNCFLHPYLCGEGQYCSQAGVCAPAKLTAGAICGISNGMIVDGECAPGLVCGNADAPNGGSPQDDETCLPAPTSGQPCMLGQCASGLYCVNAYDGSLPLCAPRLEQGDACTRYYDSDDCASGLECRAGECAPVCE